MNLQLERKRRSPDAAHRLVSIVENCEHLTLTVIAVPSAEPPARRTTSGDCPDVPFIGDHEDDLANATWEDAEWQ